MYTIERHGTMWYVMRGEQSVSRAYYDRTMAEEHASLLNLMHERKSA